MDADNEARQKVFAAAKYDLAAVSSKFAAAKVLRFKGPGVQTESTYCSENCSRCSDNMSS